MGSSKGKLIKLKPIFKERIWGGTKLREAFHYEIPSEDTGECWAISALKDGDCQISEGEYKGKTLCWLYENHREIFGDINSNEFPLLIKLIDASDNLSIQVHPDDKYAKEIEGQLLGKTEAWVVLDCSEDALLEIGHKAASREKVREMVCEGIWEDFLNYINIKKGDFFYIPSGTVHGICKNTLIYEVQQACDLTYRLYDYNRIDSKTGNKRELHKDKAIDVITAPQRIESPLKPIFNKLEGYEKITYTENEYFKVYKYHIEEKTEIISEAPFLLCTVIEGAGEIDGEEIIKGDNFIIPADHKHITITGNIEIIVVSV